jgi:hypothetical protein
VSEIGFRDLAPSAYTRHVVYVYFPTAGQKNAVITVTNYRARLLLALSGC